MKYPYYDKDGSKVWVDVNEPADREKFDQLWSPEYRKVAQTNVGTVLVSTIFLPIDHAFFEDDPVIFETMVFGYHPGGWLRRWWAELWRHDGAFYQWRYTKQGYAETGHRLIVEAVRERRLGHDTIPRIVNDEVLGDVEEAAV